MMKTPIRFFYILITACIVAGCIEPYEFVIDEDDQVLVVEGFITDVSYNESLQYPSDGRYFFVGLSFSSDVTNKRGEPVSKAVVKLISDTGDTWLYSESTSGQYLLRYGDFAAAPGRDYRLSISLPGGDVYESDWLTLPSREQMEIGDISFEERTKETYKIVAGEKRVETIEGVTVLVHVPENKNKEPYYYRWDFEPAWVYTVPLRPYINKTCWIRSNTYVSNYILQEDYIGDYKKDLFFMETHGNERLFESFSLLLKQYSLDDKQFYFFKELQEQASGGAFFDKPPFNLETNLHAVESDKKVVGYFWIASEQAKRWYFNIYDLSYPVYNHLREECLKPYGPPAVGDIDSCKDCLGYPNGQPSLNEPEWWP